MDFGDVAKIGAIAVNPLMAGQAIAGAAGAQKLGQVVGDNAANQIPEYNAPQLDAATASMQQNQRVLASMSGKDIAAEHMAGTASAGGLLPQYSNGDDAMKAALNRRTQKSFQGDLNKMQSKAEVQGYATQAKRLNAQAQTENQMNQWQHGVQMQQYQVQQAKNQARNQAQAAVFGTIGKLGGSVAGGFIGGPAGISAGGDIGAKGAQMAGGAGESESSPESTQMRNYFAPQQSIGPGAGGYPSGRETG